MFHNDNGGTFWIAKDNYPVPVQMTIYVDSSYDSPNASVKESLKHHSSGFAFWTGGGSLREINYGLTRQDYKPDRLMTSENAELIGVNKVLKYVFTLAVQPERLIIICDNQTLVKKLNDIREVCKILGKFPASEYPKSLHKAEYDTYMYLMRSSNKIELTFQHIKGHADSHFNHIADRMAHLGKSIKSGSEHPEDQILKNLSNISLAWKKAFLPQEIHGEFLLGVSEKSYATLSGTQQYGFCLYDNQNNIFHTGIFEAPSKGAKDIQENEIIAAVCALKALTPLISKGFNINIVVSNVKTANILHSYVSDYVIPEGILKTTTMDALNGSRKTIKKYSGLSFSTREQLCIKNDNITSHRFQASSKAGQKIEEYISHRSLYALRAE